VTHQIRLRGHLSVAVVVGSSLLTSCLDTPFEGPTANSSISINETPQQTLLLIHGLWSIKFERLHLFYGESSSMQVKWSLWTDRRDISIVVHYHSLSSETVDHDQTRELAKTQLLWQWTLVVSFSVEKRLSGGLLQTIDWGRYQRPKNEIETDGVSGDGCTKTETTTKNVESFLAVWDYKVSCDGKKIFTLRRWKFHT